MCLFRGIPEVGRMRGLSERTHKHVEAASPVYFLTRGIPGYFRQWQIMSPTLSHTVPSFFKIFFLSPRDSCAVSLCTQAMGGSLFAPAESERALSVTMNQWTGRVAATPHMKRVLFPFTDTPSCVWRRKVTQKLAVFLTCFRGSTHWRR